MAPIPILQTFAYDVWADGSLNSSDLLVLGVTLAVLVGGLVMPALVRAVRALFIVVGFFMRAVWRFLIDKLIESMIVAFMTLLGGLSLLEAFATYFGR